MPHEPCLEDLLEIEAAQPAVSGSTAAAQPKRPTELISFSYGFDLFSIKAGLVEEVISPLNISPLPNCPSQILGVAARRGNILALLDVNSWVCPGNRLIPSSKQRWIVLRGEPGSTQFAFAVDKLAETHRADDEAAPSFLDIVSFIDGIELGAA